MGTEREQVDAFLKKCDEVMQSKYIMADSKIGELLKCIVSSDLLYAFFRDVTKNFDYGAACEKCMNYVPQGDSRKKLLFPEDPVEKIAFIFCLLADFDSKAIDLGEFLQEYFYEDGSFFASFYAFSNQVIKPFRNAVRTVFAVGLSRPQEEKALPLEEERALVFRSRLSDGKKVDALLLLNGALSPAARKDRSLLAALLAGYLAFAQAAGWQSEHLPALSEALSRIKEEL